MIGAQIAGYHSQFFELPFVQACLTQQHCIRVAIWSIIQNPLVMHAGGMISVETIHLGLNECRMASSLPEWLGVVLHAPSFAQVSSGSFVIKRPSIVTCEL